jgi:hypothetical protein
MIFEDIQAKWQWKQPYEGKYGSKSEAIPWEI